jgi:hypothetical protein
VNQSAFPLAFQLLDIRDRELALRSVFETAGFQVGQRIFSPRRRCELPPIADLPLRDKLEVCVLSWNRDAGRLTGNARRRLSNSTCPSRNSR